MADDEIAQPVAWPHANQPLWQEQAVTLYHCIQNDSVHPSNQLGLKVIKIWSVSSQSDEYWWMECTANPDHSWSLYARRYPRCNSISRISWECNQGFNHFQAIKVWPELKLYLTFIQNEKYEKFWECFGTCLKWMYHTTKLFCLVGLPDYWHILLGPISWWIF